MHTRAHEYFEKHVRPTVLAWKENPVNERLAMQAAVALNQMTDYYFHAYDGDMSRLFGASNLGQLREVLATKSSNFQVLRDVAEAFKHVKLNRKNRVLTSAGQTTVLRLGWGEAEWGVDEWGSPPKVIVILDDGTKIRFGAAVDDVFALWDSLLK